MKKLNLSTELCGIILGVRIYGLAVIGINIPFRLTDGGVTDIALLLHNLFGFAPSATSLPFNLPLLLISLFLLEKHAFLRTIVGTFALVFFLHLWGSPHIYFAIDSLLINSLMAGILSGIDCGLVSRFSGNTGGTDTIYQAAEKYFHIKIGKSLLLITFDILVASLLYLDLTYSPYTLLGCSILSYTLNKVKYLEVGSVLPQLEVKQTTETFEPSGPLEQLEHWFLFLTTLFNLQKYHYVN